jgi:preprotein translocase subunit SecE
VSLFCIILVDKKVAKKAIFNYLFFSNMNKLISYIKESISEMKKVTWPTKKETYNYTILVIGISLAVAVFLGALDFIFNLGLQLIV